MSQFALGIVQLTSVDDRSQNVISVEDAYRQACDAGAELVVFPENTLYFRIGTSSPSGGALESGAPEWDRLARLVSARGVPLMLTTAIIGDDRKMRNSTVCLRPDGGRETVYSKLHLFDVDVPGAPPSRESDHFEPGQAPSVVDVNGWRFGLSICYDLRFAELYLKYAQAVDVILVPSAFLVPTGQAHWHVLLRARAIENQCFVAAPAQSGEHRSGESVRRTYGHSLVVDPWGVILAELESAPEVRVVALARKDIDRVRRQIPMSEHRRL